MQYAVKATNLVKQYNGFNAVDSINFSVNNRECFGFLGPNGAGKTTIVKMIYGLSPITSGQLEVLGLDVTKNIRKIKSRLGVVPQEDNLDPDLTVWENLIIYASYFDIDSREAGKRTAELLNFMELEAKTSTFVEQLSGGMKRRLAITRALINHPELLILDEPTTGLDPQARQLVWQRLRELKNNGVTLLLTTHYLEEASYLCDRLVIMEHGQIIEEGTPNDLVTRHVGKEVLDISPFPNHLTSFLQIVKPYIKGYQEVGNHLLLYSLNTPELLQTIAALPDRFAFQYIRPATLEDVFLKLTGRELKE